MPGIAAVADNPAEAELRKLEYFELSSRQTERGVSFKGGAKIYDAEGDRSGVVFPRSAITGATITHNHPSGGSFSLEDIKHVASTYDAAEMRAVGRPLVKGSEPVTYLYRARKLPDGSWPDLDKLQTSFDHHFKQVNAELGKEQKKTGPRPSYVNAEHAHRTWIRVANQLGFSYERIALD